MIRVFIVDDHELVRVGLRRLLEAEPDIEVIGEAHSVASAISSIPALSPDVVLCDYQMPDGTGLTMIKVLLEIEPGLKILVVSVVAEPDIPRRLLAAGAMGFVGKVSGATVLTALRQVAIGHSFIESPPALGAGVQPTCSAALDRLSTREVEVLRLLLMGCQYSTIGSRLGISVNSVKTLRLRAFQKLNIASRAELHQLALAAGWRLDD